MTNTKQLATRLPSVTHCPLPEIPVVTDALIAEMTQRIVDACDPEKVILFGSYAYGTPHENSDVDLFVVMKPKGESETNHHRVVQVRAAAKIPFLPLDVIVRTPAEVEPRLAMGDFFIQHIVDRGMVLYQRDTARRMG